MSKLSLVLGAGRLERVCHRGVPDPEELAAQSLEVALLRSPEFVAFGQHEVQLATQLPNLVRPL